ncbi:hypothetical protein E2C01_084141 [Portunus trituberculatus]|uniref:Uncharacterized protein n=1 Tax=Portunus trituberculatus TaxID=210409 RepID=A0A5B7J380_PORTR|nr:hypothetical protein [Portunus trituberculatus]
MVPWCILETLEKDENKTRTRRGRDEDAMQGVSQRSMYMNCKQWSECRRET